MDFSWVPEGIDQETAFRIEVKIESFWNKQSDGKNAYFKGRKLQWVVDSDIFSLCDLKSDLFDKICWGSSQTPKIWFFNETEGSEQELLAESQILDIFSFYKQERKLFFLVILFDIDGGSNLQECHAPSQPSARIIPCSHSLVERSKETISKNYSDLDDDFVNIGADEEVQFGAEAKVENKEDSNVNEELVCSEPNIAYDPNNPKIKLKALFPDSKTFKSALKHYAIKNKFEYKPTKSDKKRLIAKCKNPDCPWRIRASKLQGSKAFMVTVLPHEHTCPSTSMVDSKMISQSWVAEKVGNWLRKNPTAGPKQVQDKLEDDFNVKFTYNKAYEGRKVSLRKMMGPWEESFKELYNFKAELEMKYPGSIVEIECTRVHNKMHFSKLFVALKPCIDGFLNGCRPYMSVDSTILTGIYNGQLAAATGIDGCDGLYPVAFGAFDMETKDTWTWFMQQLHNAIGNPSGLAISSDADKGLDKAIASTFPDCDHRECMRHLMDNFKKKFHGSIYEQHMSPAARAYTEQQCKNHMDNVRTQSEQAIVYLDSHHKQHWCRSQFSELTKCDYETNNIAESFNSWIRDLKELHLIDLVDQLRCRIMVRFGKRKKKADKFTGVILPSVMRELNLKSRNLGKIEVSLCSDNLAEVSELGSDGKLCRYIVNLESQQCACREWQLTGLPCKHAIAFICTIRGSLENYVHDYYSVARFRVAYRGEIMPMNDKSQWAKSDLGFIFYPPKHKRPRGRPRKQRIPGCLEPDKKRHQCKRCKNFGHQARTCKQPPPQEVQTQQGAPPVQSQQEPFANASGRNRKRKRSKNMQKPGSLAQEIGLI